MSGRCVNCGKPGPHFAPPSSGHPGGFTCAPATPEATEREAREVMERTLMRYAEIEHPNRDHPALTWKFERDVEADRADLDAYRAAVAAVEYERGRRAERERIAIREAMTTHPAARGVTVDMVMIPRSLAHKADGLLSLVGYRHKVHGVGVDAAEFIEASLEFRAALTPDAEGGR